jgi:hypothetical protein
MGVRRSCAKSHTLGWRPKCPEATSKDVTELPVFVDKHRRQRVCRPFLWSQHVG